MANFAASISGPGEALSVTEVPVNHPDAGEILIRNQALAIQPLDAKMLHLGYRGAGDVKSYPFVFGTSGAGIVEEIGKGVKHFSIGDRVVFDTQAYVKDANANLREGTWQRLVIVGVKTVAKIGNAPFEQAALIEFPLQTAVAALQIFLGMGKPGSGSSSEKVLIWGAGGAVGSYAVQYAKSVGYTIIVTASPKDAERQKNLGAAEVVDYKASDTVDRLKALGPYKFVMTASGDQFSQEALAAILQPTGGKFASVLGGDVDLPANVARIYVPFSQAAQRDEFGDFRTWWYEEYAPSVLAEQAVKAVSFVKRERGLAALQEASLEVFERKVRGKVLVNPQE